VGQFWYWLVVDEQVSDQPKPELSNILAIPWYVGTVQVLAGRDVFIRTFMQTTLLFRMLDPGAGCPRREERSWVWLRLIRHTSPDFYQADAQWSAETVNDRFMELLSMPLNATK